MEDFIKSDEEQNKDEKDFPFNAQFKDLAVFSGDRPNKLYASAMRHIMEKGMVVSPRGLKTYEIQPAIHEIISPHKKLCTMPGRRANPFFNMAENMWILGGHGNHEWVCSFNSKLKEYQLDDDSNDFNAPYGRRIRFFNRFKTKDKKFVSLTKYTSVNVGSLPQVDQLLHCYESLKKDKDSRQAVVSLWNPLFDYYLNETKDRPCNTTIYFKIRNNKLNMTVSNRSNDLHLGLYGVNFVQFGHLQEFMAAALNVDIGHYIHMSDSLHIYDTSEVTKRIAERKYDYDVYDYVEPTILKHEDIGDVEDSGKNLGSYLLIADEVMSNSEITRAVNNGEVNIRYSKSNYSRACTYYLSAYDFYKIKDYWKSMDCLIKMIKESSGFYDWAIAGLEFINRSNDFQSVNNRQELIDKVLYEIRLNSKFKNEKFLENTRRYINEH